MRFGVISAIFSIARDRRASVGMMAALTIIPAMLVAGFGMDYALGMRTRSRLDAAADAAALAALTAARELQGAGQSDTAVISGAEAAGASFFTSNAGADAAILTRPASVSVTKSGRSFTAVASYQAARPNLFGGLANALTMNISGGATASVTLPSYLDFYLLLDVSGSMGIPSTTGGQARMSAINPDQLYYYPGGCAFACHFAPAMCSANPPTSHSVQCVGYDLSRTNGTSSRVANDYCPQPGLSTCIQLRVDAVAYAVQQLLQTAQQTETLTNQFRIGLYPFIVHMQPYTPITSNLTTVTNAAANLPSLLDTGSGTNVAGQLGSGGTHIDNALTELNSAITTVGDGSSAASPLPFVFFVTDGAQDNQYYLNSGGWTGSNHATTLNTANCSLLKNRGITIAVLYVPYVAIQNVNTSFAGDEDDYANWNIPYIPPSLQSCASSGFFFTANAPSDITAAMQQMFANSVKAARLIR